MGRVYGTRQPVPRLQYCLYSFSNHFSARHVCRHIMEPYKSPSYVILTWDIVLIQAHNMMRMTLIHLLPLLYALWDWEQSIIVYKSCASPIPAGILRLTVNIGAPAYWPARAACFWVDSNVLLGGPKKRQAEVSVLNIKSVRVNVTSAVLLLQ